MDFSIGRKSYGIGRSANERQVNSVLDGVRGGNVKEPRQAVVYTVEQCRLWSRGKLVSEVVMDGSEFGEVCRVDCEDGKVRLSADDEDHFHDEHSYALPPHLRGHGSAALLSFDGSDAMDKPMDASDADQSEVETLFNGSVQSSCRIGGLPTPSAAVDERREFADDCILLSDSFMKHMEYAKRAKVYGRQLEQNKNNLLPLNDEEKRMCEKEGVKLPLEVPLTKAEERVIKRIRRKIRNKRSAQESRKRKQAYVEALELKVKASSDEIVRLENRVNHVMMKNKQLEVEIARLRGSSSALESDKASATSTSSYVAVFLMSVAIVVTTALHSYTVHRSMVPVETTGEEILAANESYLIDMFDSPNVMRPLPILVEDDIIGGLYGTDSDMAVMVAAAAGETADDIADGDFQNILNHVETAADDHSQMLTDIDFGFELSAISKIEPYNMPDGTDLITDLKLEPFTSDIGDTWCAPLPSGMFEMWYQILFWVFISSVLVHGIAAAVAFCVLRKHPVMRWYALALLIMGILGPLTWGNITSAMVAWIGLNSISVMPPLYAFIAGVAQTILCTVVSFCRIFPSL